MSHRQKVLIGVAISAGFCTSLAIYLYIRRRRQLALTKPPNSDRYVPPRSVLSSLKPHHGRQYDEITSSSQVNDDDSETVRFQSGDISGAIIEVDIPGGGAPLSPEQATILTRFLYESLNNEDLLHRALTSIANAATFKESQINLTNAGCLTRLRELLSMNTSDATKCKVLMALNNLALNEFAITQYSGFVSTVFDLCRSAPSGSLVRLCALKLLVNMCVLEHLHAEYMAQISQLSSLIQSTLLHDSEALETAKILVNLSTNKVNLENLLKLTGLDLKTLVDACTTSSKKQIDDDLASKREDIFLRYMTFLCNVAEHILAELQRADSNNNQSWLNEPTPQPHNALYFQLFDYDKQMSAKALLRPQWSLHEINMAIKRFRQALDTIRRIQFESSVSSVHEELNQNDYPTVAETSTPKKSAVAAAEMNHDDDNVMNNLEKEANEEFDNDDDTTLAVEPSGSNQSLASFRSAYSTNETSNLTSPEKTISV